MEGHANVTPAELAAQLDPTADAYVTLKRDLLQGVGTAIYNRLQLTTPVRTGDLLRSEVLQPISTGDFAQIDITAPYAGFVDQGTSRMPGRHYVQAAIDAAGPDIDGLIAATGEAWTIRVARG